MAYISYENETERVEVCNGNLPLDYSNMSDEEKRQLILEAMKNNGYDIENPDELEIVYSEDPSNINFMVFRNEELKVPYKIDEEEIFSDVVANDPIRMSEEESRKKIIDLMRMRGIDVSDDEQLRIEYEGVDDDYGVSESLQNQVRVYRVVKTKLDEAQEDNSLEQELEERIRQLTSLKESYKKASTKAEKNKLRDEIYDAVEKVDGFLKEISESIVDEDVVSSIDIEIAKVKDALRREVKAYDDASKKMHEAILEHSGKLEEFEKMSSKEIENVGEEYSRRKSEIDRESVLIKRNIQELQRRLNELEDEKNRIDSEVLQDALVSDKVILDSPASDQIDALFSTDDSVRIEGRPKSLKLSSDDYSKMTGAISDLPEKVVNTSNKERDYEPAPAPQDLGDSEDLEKMFSIDVPSGKDVYSAVQQSYGIDVRNQDNFLVDEEVKDPYGPDTNTSRYTVYRKINKVQNPDKIDSEDVKFNLYVDGDNYYCPKDVVSSYNLEVDGDEVLVNGEACYKINSIVGQYMIDHCKNRGNGELPFNIDIVDSIDINNNDNDNIHDDVVIPEDKMESRKELKEKIVIYLDLDNNSEKYVKKNILTRFNLDPDSAMVMIDGKPHFRIDQEDYEYIVGNASNEYSPYEVEERITNLGKRDTVSVDVPSVDEDDTPKKDKDVRVELVTLVRDLNDNGRVYADKNTLARFGITPEGKAQVIRAEEFYKVSPDALQMIEKITKESKDPLYTLKYFDVRIKKHVRPHVEEIISKLTQGLSFGAKDVKRYKASNIQITRAWRDELHSGNWLYNVVHFVPATIRASVNFFRKLSGKLLTTPQAVDNIEEIKRRANEDLTEEELEVLFEEYKGSQLKTDMNVQINDIILERLRSFGMEKVEKYNARIKIAYSHLFTYIGEIESIDNELNNNEISEDERRALESRRYEFVEKAARLIRSILDERREANNILSGGIHGLEEDFKAVSTKLNYVGKRFGDVSDFDTKLQEKLGKNGAALNDALASGDNEAILENFMALETTYSENTKFDRGFSGNKSVGSKYYTPLAERFDYRDDPFIRDLFSSVAVTSAVVSAANAVYVHQIEANNSFDAVQNDINRVNAHNDEVINEVHDTARKISDKRGVFQEGMEAQAHQDVLNTANVLERDALDMHNWNFGGAYQVTDDANHALYNQFHDDVTSRIDEISSNYGSGSITQADALREMGQVVSYSQGTLVDVCDNCLSILRDYAASHPEFDLAGVEESMNYIVAHPDAIVNANDAAIEVTDLASSLSNLSVEHASLSALPSDMLSTLICAAAATSLAMKVCSDMENKYGKTKGYSNEVTDMMDNYLNGEEEKTEGKHR